MKAPAILCLTPETDAAWLRVIPQPLLSATLVGAQQLANDHAVSVIIADEALGGLELLAWARACHPSARRLLLAPYESIPRLMLSEHRLAIEHLLPKPPHADNLALLLRDLTGDTAPHVPRAPGYDLLVQTVRALVKLRGVVIRHLPRDGTTTQLQLVVPNNAAAEQTRVRMPADWGWPIKPRGAVTTKKHRAHPVMKLFGGELSEDQEVYVQTLDDGLWAYMAFLPWARRPEMTVVIGFAANDESKLSAASANEELASLHDVAVAETLEYPLPAIEQDGPSLAPGYDWIVSPYYVGPDRRARETSFVNRYMFIGQRRRRLRNLPARVMPFIDGFTTEAAWLAAAYLLLSGFDTLATLWFVSRGRFEELNPLLRPLIESSAWRFILLKNVFSLTALFVMVRLHLVRLGRVMLWLNAAVYLALCVYWVKLIARL